MKIVFFKILPDFGTYIFPEMYKCLSFQKMYPLYVLDHFPMVIYIDFELDVYQFEVKLMRTNLVFVTQIGTTIATVSMSTPLISTAHSDLGAHH